MKVDAVKHWLGPSIATSLIPDKYAHGGACEITVEDIETLAATYDVAIMHHRVSPSNDPLAQEAHKKLKPPPPPAMVVLWLDDYGGRFRQR